MWFTWAEIGGDAGFQPSTLSTQQVISLGLRSPLSIIDKNAKI